MYADFREARPDPRHEVTEPLRDSLRVAQVLLDRLNDGRLSWL